MTVAVFGRTGSQKNIDAVKHLCELTEQKKINLRIYKPFADKILKGFPDVCNCSHFENHDDLLKDVDFLFSIGGDGTLLNTVELVKNADIPLVGVNTGRLGFLANFKSDQLDLALDLLVNKEYTEDHRSLLEVKTSTPIFGERNFALNEFTIQKKDPAAIIKVQAYVNGEYLTSYWSDGIIVSTPTGSTGYSMSAGGSIVLPGSGVFVLSPIAPHNLNLRPIIIPDNAEITFHVEEHRGECYCTLDSKYWKLNSSQKFTLKKSEFSINIVRPPGESFIDTLRNKLMWGLDNRNK